MYQKHFHLKQKPFSINADPDFLWLGPCHARVLATLTLALDKGGVLVLTGDVGTGKTTLVNSMVQGLPSKIHTARIADPCLELHLLFSTIAQELGFDFHSEKKFETLLVKFLDTLLPLDEQCLVIVDEAQRIGPRFLKTLYSWQGLRNGHLPITVLLVGQNEFAEMLPSFTRERFLERTTVNLKLVPLNREETANYVQFRMLHSGTEDEIFMEAALDDIAFISKGYPRMINILCDHCLLLAHRKGNGVVDEAVVTNATEKLLLPNELPPPTRNKTKKRSIPGLKRMAKVSLLCMGIAFFMVFFIVPDSHYGDFKKSPPPAPKAIFNIPENSVEMLNAMETVNDDNAAGKVAKGSLPESATVFHGGGDDNAVEKGVGKPGPKEEPPSVRVRQTAAKPASKPFASPGGNKSVKTLIDEVFKGVEHRMRQLPEATEGVAGPLPVNDPIPWSNPIEEKDLGTAPPDPGDVITWLLERKESSN